jgi:hypothetical protein
VREDAHYVDQLQRVLEAADVPVWRDTADLWPGQDWRKMIRRAITDNALVFIACFSSQSVARKKSYQNEELVLAVEQIRQRQPDDPWLIPIRFNDCEVPDLDLGGGRTLGSIQRADLFGEHWEAEIARLLTAIQRLLGQDLVTQDDPKPTQTGMPKPRRHGIVTKNDPPRTCFSVGNLDTTMLVVEGDGEQVISEQNVHVIVDPEPVVLPSEMQAWRTEILREQQQRARTAHQHFWNGLNYAVSEFSVARTVLDEEPEIFFRLKPSDYGNFLASQQLDRRFGDGTTPRSRYLEPYRANPLEVPDFMCSSFGTNAAVLTADGFFIFAKRSAHVGSRPNTWSSSANEALSRTLDSRGRSAPDLYDVMRRGIKEELAIDEEEYTLEMLIVQIEMELHQWGASWLAMLHDLTGEDVIARRLRGVADKWEHSELKLVSAEPENVFQFIQEKISAGEMAPQLPLYFFALVRRYGRRRVERAAKKIFR